MEKLKPCPFCGGEARLSHAGAKHIIFCPNCVRLPADGGYINQEQAIEQWNNRLDNWIEFTVEKVDVSGFGLFNCPIPEDGQEVLVTDGRYVWQDTFLIDDACYFDSGWGIFDKITHWQPLPKPPK